MPEWVLDDRIEVRRQNTFLPKPDAQTLSILINQTFAHQKRAGPRLSESVFDNKNNKQDKY